MNDINQYGLCEFTIYKNDNQIDSSTDYLCLKNKYNAIACLSEIASIASDNLKLSLDYDKKIIKSIEMSYISINGKTYLKLCIKTDIDLDKTKIYNINKQIECKLLNNMIKVHNYTNKKDNSNYVIYISLKNKLKFNV